MRPSTAAAIALLLAGCAGAPPQQADARFDVLGLEATETTGVIRGLVVDDAINPLAGATVTLSSTGQSATTDAGGLFGFEGLAAQTHFLSVEKPGYRPTQQSADVVAGVAEPGVVKVLLEADPSTAPYVVQQSHHGYLQCSFKAANVVFDSWYCDPAGLTGLSANDDARPWFPAAAKPTFYQSEITWDSTQAAGAGLVTIQVACDEGDCDETESNRLCNVRGPAPLTCRVSAADAFDGDGRGHGIDETGLGDSLSGYSVEVFANCFECAPGTAAGAGVVLEQRFEVYNHLFYRFEPPEDWTFLEDGPPSLPPT